MTNPTLRSDTTRKHVRTDEFVLVPKVAIENLRGYMSLNILKGVEPGFGKWVSCPSGTMVRYDELTKLLAAGPSITQEGRKNCADIGAATLVALFAWWLKFDADCHEEGGQSVHDGMHVIPATWPTRGNLKVWIETIERLDDAALSVAGRG